MNERARELGTALSALFFVLAVGPAPAFAQGVAPADEPPRDAAAPAADTANGGSTDASAEAVSDAAEPSAAAAPTASAEATDAETSDAETSDAESADSDAEAASDEPEAPPVHDPTLLTIGVTTASIGVVSFAVLAASAVTERGRIAGGCGGMCSAADRDGADGLGIAANVAAGVALVGAVLSLAGIALMGRPEDDETEEREEEIAVSLGPTGVVVTGSF